MTQNASKKNVCKLAVAAVLTCMAATAQAEILIGSSVSSTGFASFLGEPEEQTLKILVDDINAKGGVA